MKLRIIIFLALISLAIYSHGQSSSSIKDYPSVYVFDVGDILIKDISHWNPGVDAGKSIKFSCSAYLIRHPKGDLIWDTGLPDALIDIPEGRDSPLMLSKMTKTLRDQLKEIGVVPAEVKYVAISHLHGDHIGNVNLFTEATLIVQEEEYAGLFQGKNIPATVDSVKNNPSIKLKDDYDVFGDGTVIIKRAPGHTAGHQVLFIQLPEYGPLVISGDLYHFEKNRRLKGVPEFNFSREATLASMEMIETFIQEKGATLWIQHDYDQNKKIPHSPIRIK